MRRPCRIAILAVIATAGSLAACSGPSSPGPTAPAAPAGTPSPTTTQLTFDRACTQDVLLPFLKAKFDDPARDLVIESADIQRCRDGYAHVFAVTGKNAEGQPQYENEQLFLRFVDGRWQSVAEGTGISCEDPDSPPDLVAACRALGY